MGTTLIKTHTHTRVWNGCAISTEPQLPRPASLVLRLGNCVPLAEELRLDCEGTDNSMVVARGKGHECRWKWELMGTERDFTSGDGHTMQCADDVLLRYTLETCMVL